MNWETIVQKIADFWNMPVPIIGFTVGSVVLGIIWIISKTSFGRKSINWCKNQLKEMKDANDKAKADYEETIKLKDEIIAGLTAEYEEKLALVQLNRDKEREIIIAIGEKINNVKIKKIIEEYKNMPTIESISDYVQELENKYESKYELLLKRLEELENEKGKETINSDSVEETL